ncbi:MAG TPA: Asp-tRNA(Asn)/Glu-tRNA(Gln) amidotransferase subunit GatB [Patescibacteria group bacterium]|nr:Asp-tRNA(Asn)/Glu-tRNA(Gln) amidotransferase subunit GatB [Patescibacteria group bacterium]
MSHLATRSDALERYEAVIGIEVHCQVRTASKMFCACAVPPADAAPNTHTCPVCLALPGVLPTINRAAVEHVLTTGLALAAAAPAATRWDRKNYFYPDLPKGYQISQYDLPLASNGSLTIDTSEGPVTIGITRAHLEEDTAKLVHATGPDGRRVSLVDFNRAGVPLMEIVSEPDVRTAEQARRYAEELRLLLRTIDVSDAEMENGQMRVEANVSVRPRGTESLGIRTEVKNMNSLRAVERAVAYEIERQAAALDAGRSLRQETRGWDDTADATYVMRVKESSDDYRYFPEPDLPPLHLDPAWLDALRAALPELPAARRLRYVGELGLSPYDAAVLAADEGMHRAFEAISAAGPGLPPKEVSNLVTGDYGRALKETAARTPEGLAGRAAAASLAHVLGEVLAGRLSRPNAKEVVAEHVASGAPAPAIIVARGFAQISDAGAVGRLVEDVLVANPAAVADYRAGRAQAVGFLVGQVMKASRGQANAALVQAALRERLGPAGDPPEDRQ